MLKSTCAAGLMIATACIGSAPLAAQDLPRAERMNSTSSWYYYPSRSLRNEQQGEVSFRMIVDENGRAESCVVTEPSPYAELNEATCEQGMRRARFVPATDLFGSRIKSVYENRAIWVLEVEHVYGPMPEATNLPFADYAGEETYLVLGYELTIDPAGAATSCEIVYPSGVPDFDAIACDAIMGIISDTRFNPGFHRNSGEPYMRAFRGSVIWNALGLQEDCVDEAEED
tara:strand:+ start:1109 stop:1795 length:687 start_codon:yes stop_codon:yes gene_type:complete